MDQEREAAMAGERVSEPGREDTFEAGEHQPTTLGSSTQAPDSPPPSIQISSSPSSLDQYCAPSQAPTMNSGCLDRLSYDQLRELRKNHGRHRKDSKAALKSRLVSTQ